MGFREVYEKEKNVVLYGQSEKFRIIKYAIIIPIAITIYYWKGPRVFLYTLLIAILLSLAIHFLFRYMSDGWTKSWGPYKSK